MLSERESQQLAKQLDREDSLVASVFNALGDRSRFRMFKLLTERDDLCVTDIANILGITVPAASQQLKTLEAARLIDPKREGQMICYQVRSHDPLVKAVIRTVASITASYA